MSTFNTKLISSQEVADRTKAFRFEKPTDFTFVPGQFINVTLIDPPETDDEGNRRTFSISSSPGEDFIMVTTRLRDTAFKRVLSAAAPGTEVKVAGPAGRLTLHDDSARAAVVLTGGIGITPFRSILLHAATAKVPHHIYLFYANRRPEDAAFLTELQELEKANPNYKLIACMTKMEDSVQTWQGETGSIDAAMIGRHLNETTLPIYYSTGPPGMVNAMHGILSNMGVDDKDIRLEEFAGY